ncbi:MAG TPA: FAD-dependent monooxygenase [Polyangiaceae bacterium]
MREGLGRVLVVGAGPTGLSVALCLRACGVPFDLVDVKSGPSRESKALALNPLSLDQLDLLGYPDAVGARGRRVSRMNPIYGETRLTPIDLRWLDHDRPSFVAQPQDATERELIAALATRGADVAWNTELTGVADRGQDVEVTLRSGIEAPIHRTYAWVVGCEGKRSVVREAIGGEFVGAEYPMHFVLGDFELDWDGDPGQAYYFVYDDTFFVFAPIADGRWRVTVKHDGAPSPCGPKGTAITGPVCERFGRDIFRSGPSWISQSPIYLKLASRLRAGRLFIAGDAAHLFSPIGGTGMNTGMQDAFNLGWKLGFVARGWAPEELLASYETERLEAIRANAAATDAMTRLITRIERTPEKLAPFLPHLARRRLLSRQFPMAQSGLALRYSRPHGVAEAKGRVGSVCRGLPAFLKRIQGSSMRPAYRVLAYTTAGEGAHVERLARACAPFGSRVVLHQACAEGGERPAPRATPLDATALRRLGLTHGAALLVRPDGIVACEGAVSAPEPLYAHLNAVLTKGLDDE